MLLVRWRSEALDDLLGITTYIAQFDEMAALKVQARIEASVMSLVEHPFLGRPGRRAGTRELLAHPNYLVIYAVGPDTIEVTSVVHTRREYP
ncbi:MAG: type II toxin-antitoxin system RelE/ParE family toxin [Candidatus Devosia phytovorans]|uniref:Type II toxin-antitoxin system RelE/ParE family toxin n=1 Tax=Candidatus Devosia phytovorans TaxID=3121372 RepID=A0AAJ6B0L1_9HYPH|nr:type II toxin-antitoxin system RelE/ParE family toxin [Devosia sp.]WEK04821.1 MAG: type II toxin-antitoxin system RelE/ParE family toxin [Devosia sp.]